MRTDVRTDMKKLMVAFAVFLTRVIKRSAAERFVLCRNSDCACTMQFLTFIGPTSVV
jgi:hypothetical protein